MTEGMLKMMGVFSKLERNIIRQRVRSGMANAKDKGVSIRRYKLTIDTLPEPFLNTTHCLHLEASIKLS